MICAMFHVAMILFDRFIVVDSAAVFLGYTTDVQMLSFGDLFCNIN